jgi:glycosyltransferase involved in cell wall biosynthesis
MTSAPENNRSSKRLVVAHVVKTLSVGGVQRVLLEILKHTDTTRFRPLVLCMERRGEWGEDLAAGGMQVDLFGREYPWRHVFSRKMLGLWPLVQWLRVNRVDVLHIHMPKAALFLILAGKLAGVPCIVLHHHALYRDHHWASLTPARLWMESRVTRLADALIAVSETVSACTRETFGLSRERITVIPNAGISPDSGAAPQLAAPCPVVPEGAKVIGVVGRTVPDKCFEDLLDAAPRVLAREPDTQFWIVGDEKSRQSVRPQLEEQAQRLQIEKNVHFLGFRNDVPALLSRIQIGVMCSRTEGCPNTLLEFMGAGVPSVVTDIPSLTIVVEHEKSALVVPLHNPERLADALVRLIQDPALSRRLAAEGQRMSQAYSWSDTTAACETLYQTVLRGKGKWPENG